MSRRTNKVYRFQCDDCRKTWSRIDSDQAGNCPFCGSGRVSMNLSVEAQLPVNLPLYACRRCGCAFEGTHPKRCPACAGTYPQAEQQQWDARVSFSRTAFGGKQMRLAVPQQFFAVDGKQTVFVLQADGRVKMYFSEETNTGEELMALYEPVSDWCDIVSLIVGSTGVFGITRDGTVRVGYAEEYEDEAEDIAEWEDHIVTGAENAGLVCITSDGIPRASSAYDDCFPYDWNSIASVCIEEGGDSVIVTQHNGKVLAESLFGDLEELTQEAAEWENIRSVQIGSGLFGFLLGLTEDGRVLAIGDNSQGQCDTLSWDSVIQIAAGNNFSLGLRADGTVLAAGNKYNLHFSVADWKNVIAIAARGNIAYGLCEDGTILCTDRSRNFSA